MSDEMVLGLVFFIIGLVIALVDVLFIILHKKCPIADTTVNIGHFYFQYYIYTK
mgnify:CR=1 FL=1